MKIGVGYTVHNRNEIAYESIIKMLDSIVTVDNISVRVVDDASRDKFEIADYRFNTNAGIAVVKNKCIELLYDAGCTHFFLFDDDLYPTVSNWWVNYINSGLEHACWNYNRKEVRFNVLVSAKTPDYEPTITGYAEYEKPNGCMLYATRKVIDTVGGWDTDFKGYGYDHVNWSDRIFNNGLTPARYIDIPNSSHLFKMADCETSVSSDIRATTIPINQQLYIEKFYSKEFKPFK